MTSRRKALLLPLEFMTWPRARAWSYGAQLAVAEGLVASGADITLLPAFNEVPAGHPGSWLTRIDHWCRTRRFDEIWLWPCLSRYSEPVLAWAASRAPVRIGLIAESLSFTPGERAARPDFAQYRSDVLAQLPYLTHTCAVDEHDAAWLRRRGVESFWWPGAVPSRVVRRQVPRGSSSPAAFVGNPYGGRAEWLADARLRGWLRHEVLAEPAALTRRFDDRNSRAMGALIRGEMRRSDAAVYVAEWWTIRRRLFDGYARALRSFSAVVGLPGFVKTYAGRVVEAMAAGRPAVCAALPDRPRTSALFVDREEILLYDARDPADLAATLRRLRSEPGAAAAIAARALRLVADNHTIEARIQQVHRWMETGREPDFRARASGSISRSRSRPAATRAARALPHVRITRFPLISDRWATTKVDDLVVSIENWHELDERLRQLASDRPVVCWGAGLKGRALHSILRGAGVDVAAFVDAAPARAESIWDGLPVWPPQRLTGSQPERPFVIVTSLYAREIGRSLRAMGYRPGRDWLVAM